MTKLLKRVLSLGAAVALESAAYLVESPIDLAMNEVATVKSLAEQEDSAAKFTKPGARLSEPKICDPAVQQHSGYIDFKGHEDKNKSYFFWMFEARKAPKDAPLIIWLTGGPGCSSQLALLAENGPCTVNKDGSGTTLNPHSWTEVANVLWLDQPAGTGFSKGSQVSGEAGVASDFAAFLDGFYQALPQYKSNDLYIIGESYAGHYVPAVTHRIMQNNKDHDKSINLKGFAVGNGLTAPEVQYGAYADMAYTAGKEEGGECVDEPVVSSLVYHGMKLAAGPCTKMIQKCQEGSSASCKAAFVTCNYSQVVPYRMTGLNPYDMRKQCGDNPLCYDFDAETNFLNAAETQSAIGVTDKWASCNMMVNMEFQNDWMQTLEPKVKDLLANNVKALFYAGDCDYICNFLGNKRWLVNELGYENFDKAKDVPWQNSDGKQIGLRRTKDKLTFLTVNKAGHMVPMDQPEAALQLVQSFVNSEKDWPSTLDNRANIVARSAKRSSAKRSVEVHAGMKVVNEEKMTIYD